jgi:hypothetical protein
MVDRLHILIRNRRREPLAVVSSGIGRRSEKDGGLY